MDLPNLLNKLKSNTEEPKKFIAIEIGFDAVKTALWQSTGAHTEIINTGSVQTWTSSNIDDLITAIDTSLSDAQSNETEEPNQTIFGLPETWVDDDGIAETKKTIIKSICSKLGLKPIGYVVTTEAVVHHLRDVEGGPPSAILLQIAISEIAVSLIYLGKLEATQVVGRSTNIASDVEEGLARIPHTGHLPSRMILFTNQDDPEPIKQELISYDWQKKLEFLHFPKIESLPKEWSIRAVAIGGGAEVVESLGFPNIATSITSKEKTKISIPPIEAAVVPSKEVTTPPVTEENFGFKPVNFDTPLPEKVETEAQFPPSTLKINSSDDLGEQEFSPSLPDSETTNFSLSSADVDNIEAVNPSVYEKPMKLLMGFGQRVKAIVIKPKDSTFSSEPKSRPRWIIPLAIVSGVIVIITALIIAYVQLASATINVYVGMLPFEQQLTFTVDPASTSGSLEGLVVSGKRLVMEKTGSKTIATTGTKLVGDRAKGKVTIFNRTDETKTLPAGTVIKSNAIRFTLDTATTIASASSKENADYSVTTEPSKAEVNVTAVEIGEQYNLAKDTQFSVANYTSDNFIAVATNSLTGGSSRKVAAVSKEDNDSLNKTLIQELQSQLNAESLTASESGMRQISIGEPTITSQKYSGEKGDEASELTLEMSISQTLYQYNVNEVSLLAQQQALNALPENVQLRQDVTTVNILNTVLGNNNQASVSAQVVLQYIPRVETNDYLKQLAGVAIPKINDVLKTIPNYERYTIESSRGLVFGLLPQSSNHIILHIIPVTKE